MDDELDGTGIDQGARLWESHASWWQAEFTDGVDPEYTEQILPLIAEALNGYELVVDVGTGEGQVARHLAAAGHRVVGFDPVRSQITEAMVRRRPAPAGGADPGRELGYVQAGADAAPFRDGAADAAVACLVFEHIDAVDAAIAEVARLLRPGGVFLFLLNHPLLQTPDSGWIDDQLIDPPEQYWRIGPYLTEVATIEEVQKGVYIRFIHRPLSRYINALAAAGLHVVTMQEPAPPPGFLAQAPQYEAASTVPRLLALTCRRFDDLERPPKRSADAPAEAERMVE